MHNPFVKSLASFLLGFITLAIPQILLAQPHGTAVNQIFNSPDLPSKIEAEEIFFYGDLRYEDVDIGSRIGLDKEGRVRSLSSHSTDEEAILKRIRNSPFLVEVNLEFAHVSDRVISVISESCPVLEEISLGMPEDFYGEAGIFTNTSLKLLSKLNHLQVIRIRSNQIDDKGVKALISLPFLRELDLTGSKITDSSIDTLKRIRRLSTVAVFGTQLSKEGISELRKSRPLIEIRCDERAK